MVRRSALAGVVLALLVVTGGGCQVRATVAIRVEESGAGRVTVEVVLDADAWEHLEGPGGALAEDARLDDLTRAGWTVGEWETTPSTGGSIRLWKGFRGAGELRSVLAELGGAELVEGVELERGRGFVRDHDRLALTIDLGPLSAQLAADEELSARLAAAGLDPTATGAAFDEQLAKALRIDVVATVPGARDKLILRPGDRDELVVSSSRFNSDRVLFGGVGVSVALLGAVLVVGAIASTVRHRRRFRLAHERAAQVRRGGDDPPLM
jgi:hypothetical protein